METLATSTESEQSVMLKLNKIFDSKKTVTVYCESGQKLYTSPHLMPGWLCCGSYVNMRREPPTAEACRTYNNLNRIECKQCYAPRKITVGELVKFHNDILTNK